MDVKIQLFEGGLCTDVYCKKTDTRQYLDYASCHPRHVKKGVPYSQALKLRRICDSEKVFENRVIELKSYLTKRGFKSGEVDNQLQIAREVDRSSLLSRDWRRGNSEGRVTLSIDFHPAFFRIGYKMRELVNILHALDDMRQTFTELPRVSFRRPKNLKDELVRSKVGNRRSNKGGMVKCGKIRCQICNFVEEGENFTDSLGNRKYVSNYEFDCDSDMVVYLIKCKRYGRQYISNTINVFRIRLNNHMSSLNRYGRRQRNIPGEHLYSHFFEDGRKGLSDLVVKIIDKTDTRDPTARENFWVYKLNTFLPYGLNLRDF